MEKIIDFRSLLIQRLGKNFVNEIVEHLGQCPEQFPALYALVRDPEEKVTWRAAWVCEKLSEQFPEWFASLYDEISGILLASKHSGLRRCLLSTLHNLPVPADFPIHLYDYCIRQMLLPEEAIANQALCIKLAFKLGCAEPELLAELKIYLENAEPEYYSTAVKSTIKNTLRQLSKRK